MFVVFAETIITTRANDQTCSLWFGPFCRNTTFLKFIPKIWIPFNISYNFTSFLALCKNKQRRPFFSWLRCCHLIWKNGSNTSIEVALCVPLKHFVSEVLVLWFTITAVSTQKRTSPLSVQSRPWVRAGRHYFICKIIQFIIYICQSLLWFQR